MQKKSIKVKPLLRCYSGLIFVYICIIVLYVFVLLFIHLLIYLFIYLFYFLTNALLIWKILLERRFDFI